jgi:hypothetical protein
MADRCHCTCLLHRKGTRLKMCLRWMDCRYLLHRGCTMADRCHCTCLLHRKGTRLKMCLRWMDCRCLLHRSCTRLGYHSPLYTALNHTRNTFQYCHKSNSIRDCTLDHFWIHNS